MNRGDSSRSEAARHGASEPGNRTLFDWAREAGVADRVLREMHVEVARRRRNLRRVVAATAALAIAATSGWTWRMVRHAGSEAAVAVSPSANPQRQSLPDGSVIVLRENADMAVEFTAAVRRVKLRRGEASFNVAKDAARPFVVEAGAVSVHAVGTEFFVKRGDANVDVLVTEGCVAVTQATPGDLPAAPASPAADAIGPESKPGTLVNAGRRVSVPVDTQAAWEVLPVSPAEIDERSAWRAPKLTFARTPLHEVVETMNRYGAIRLVLEDRSLGDVRLSGAIRGDNIDALLELLATDYGIAAERRGEFQIALAAAAPTGHGPVAPVAK